MKKIKRPTLVSLTIGLIILLIKSRFAQDNIEVPLKIGKYRLVHTIAKENLYKHYALGVYLYKNKKVFIKTWSGKIKDYSYYDLLNEYFMNKILSKKLKECCAKIRIPKVLDVVDQKQTLSLVFEYVEGKNLAGYPLSKQKEAMISVMQCLKRLTSLLSQEEKNHFPKRNIMFYLLSLPFLMFLTILSNPKSAFVILKGYIVFLFGIKEALKMNLTVSHRDITLHNIMFSGDKIFLLDYGRVALTLDAYDLTYVLINPRMKQFAQTLKEKFNYYPSKFLRNYILIHNAHSHGMRKTRNLYMRGLIKQYG